MIVINVLKNHLHLIKGQNIGAVKIILALGKFLSVQQKNINLIVNVGIYLYVL
jgi:hypothetical protein